MLRGEYANRNGLLLKISTRLDSILDAGDYPPKWQSLCLMDY